MPRLTPIRTMTPPYAISMKMALAMLDSLMVHLKATCHLATLPLWMKQAQTRPATPELFRLMDTIDQFLTVKVYSIPLRQKRSEDSPLTPPTKLVMEAGYFYFLLRPAYRMAQYNKLLQPSITWPEFKELLEIKNYQSAIMTRHLLILDKIMTELPHLFSPNAPPLSMDDMLDLPPLIYNNHIPEQIPSNEPHYPNSLKHPSYLLLLHNLPMSKMKLCRPWHEEVSSGMKLMETLPSHDPGPTKGKSLTTILSDLFKQYPMVLTDDFHPSELFSRLSEDDYSPLLPLLYPRVLDLSVDLNSFSPQLTIAQQLQLLPLLQPTMLDSSATFNLWLCSHTVDQFLELLPLLHPSVFDDSFNPNTWICRLSLDDYLQLLPLLHPTKDQPSEDTLDTTALYYYESSNYRPLPCLPNTPKLNLKKASLLSLNSTESPLSNTPLTLLNHFDDTGPDLSIVFLIAMFQELLDQLHHLMLTLNWTLRDTQPGLWIITTPSNKTMYLYMLPYNALSAITDSVTPSLHIPLSHLQLLPDPTMPPFMHTSMQPLQILQDLLQKNEPSLNFMMRSAMLFYLRQVYHKPDSDIYHDLSVASTDDLPQLAYYATKSTLPAPELAIENKDRMQKRGVDLQWVNYQMILFKLLKEIYPFLPPYPT